MNKVVIHNQKRPIHHELLGSLSLKWGKHSSQQCCHGAVLGNTPSLVSGKGTPCSGIALAQSCALPAYNRGATLPYVRGWYSLQWHCHGTTLGNAPSLVSGGGTPCTGVSLAWHCTLPAHNGGATLPCIRGSALSEFKPRVR